MTVNSQVTTHKYFPGSAMAAEALPGIDFRDLDSIVVYQIAAADNSATQLIRDVDYSLSLPTEVSDGTITAMRAFADGEAIYVERQSTRKQERDFPVHETIPPVRVEDALDALTLADQEQDREQSRALMVPMGEVAPAIKSLAGKTGLLALSGGMVEAVPSDIVSTAEILAAADDVAADRIASETAAAVAAAAAAAAADTIPLKASVASALADMQDGDEFRERQPGGYDFRFNVIDDGGTLRADFLGYLPVTPDALLWESKIATMEAAYASQDAPAGQRILAATARRWGGRLMQNVHAVDAPTLTLVAPMFLRDEDGGTTPSAVMATTIDPLGFAEARAVTFNNTGHQLVLINRVDDDGFTDPLTLRVSLTVNEGVSTVGEMGIGSSSRTAGAYFTITPGAGFATIEGDIPGYSIGGIYNISISLDNATAPYDAEIYQAVVVGATGLTVTPTRQQLRGEVQAGHAKAALARPGALVNRSDGAIEPNAHQPNAVMPVGRRSFSSYSFCLCNEFAHTDHLASFVAAAAFMNTPDGGTSTLNNVGAVGMDTGTVDTYGRPYVRPGYSNSAARVPGRVLGQGPMTQIVTIERISGDACKVTYFINGFPVMKEDEIISVFEAEAITLMGQSLARKRRQEIRALTGSDVFHSFELFDHALSFEEARRWHMGAMLAHAPNAPPKLGAMGTTDSLTAFQPAPFWELARATSLFPFHAMLDARGGSKFGSGADNAYDNVDRRALRRAALEGMAWSCGLVALLTQYGTNDLVSGVMDPRTTTWQSGRSIIDGMFAEDVASVSEPVRDRIRRVLVTIPAHAGWIEPNADADDQAREVARQEYNAECRDPAQLAARGYDHLLDRAAVKPTDFASDEAGALDAFLNGENTWRLSDGIHDSQAGGTQIANDLYIPFMAQLKSEMLAA